ncbi:MAG TPA: hypothetical protein VIX37_01095 [Candidatus Sulfotelmatobacter sp.]
MLGSFHTSAGEKGLFELPDSVLLFSQPTAKLYVATDSSVGTLSLSMPPGPLSYPSLAPDGSRLAVGVLASSKTAPHRFALGVLSVKDQGWRTYGDFESIGVPAFSPDGAKVAFAAEQVARTRSFLILDTSSGETVAVGALATVVERAGLGWSPDGKRLVVEMRKGDESPVVAVFDLATSTVNQIAKGVDPVWSPSGEWIAYSDESRQTCILVHPDGAGTKVIRNLSKKFRGYRLIFYGAVWSPDGSRLLLDEMKGEGPKIDVMLLDLTNGKVTRKSQNGLPVFGWVTERR